MTDNQFNQLFGLVTKSVESNQRLEKAFAEMKQDVSVLKQDVAELKQSVSKLEDGQTRIEKEMKIMSKSLSSLAVESLQTRSRIGVLEDELELSN